MRRIALAVLLPVLLLAATRWASANLAPPAPGRIEGRIEADGKILSADGPIVFATHPSQVWVWEGALFVSDRAVGPALLPPGVRPTALRLEDLTGDGRVEVFVTVEAAADTSGPRRVAEIGYAYFPDPGTIEMGELVPFLSFDRLVDGKVAGDSAPWEEIAAYTPDDAPAGAFPDLVVAKTKNVYRPGDRFTPATLASSTAAPPARLVFDPATRSYTSVE